MRPTRYLSLVPLLSLAIAGCSESPTHAFSPDGGGPRRYDSCGPVAFVTVIGPSQLTTGQLGSYSVSATDSGGCSLDLFGGQHTVTWSATPASVASVYAYSGASATVSANAPGSAAVSAVVDGHSGSVGLVVKDPPHLASLTLTPNPGQTEVTNHAYYTATGKDQYGSSFPTGTITWSSQHTSIATIDPSTGVATGVGRGIDTIYATSGTVVGKAQLTIIPMVTTTAPDSVYSGAYTVSASVNPSGTYYYTWNERVCNNGSGCTPFTVIAQGYNVTSVTRTMKTSDFSHTIRIDLRDTQTGAVISVGAADTFGPGEVDTGGSCYPRLIC